MNRRKILLPLLGVAVTMAAQNTSDSTDVFYKHLRLNEIEVTGVTGQTKLRDMAAPVSVVTPRELRASSGTNIIDAISHQPGIAQLTTGNGISKPIIRGLGYNRVLVVHDGVRQEGQQWGDEHGLEIDALGVSSVEILKGPASLMYGSDAMAGVLIMHTTPNVEAGKVEGSLTGGYQTNSGLWGYSLNLAANFDGLTIGGRFTRRRAHAYKAPVDGYVPGTQTAELDKSAFAELRKRWGHSRLAWTSFDLTPSMAEGERDPLTGELVPATDDPKTYSRTLPFQKVHHEKVAWDNAVYLGPGMLKAVFAYQQNRRREYEDNENEPELYFRLHTGTYDLRYQLTAFNLQLAAGIGGMYQESENLAEEALIPAYRLFDIGGYATAKKDLDRWTLSGGLRLDNRHIRNYGNYSGLTGSIGAVYHASRSLNLRLNMARGFRAPNMSELGSDGVHEGTLRYETGNPDLKSEFSWQADLGADYRNEYVEAQVSLFLNRIENYIFSHRINVVIDPAYRTFTYTQGDALLKGFEASVDFHPIHQLHFGNSFSLVDARQLHQPEESRYLPMTPAPRWNSDLKYEITHKGRTFNNAYVAVGLDCFLAQDHYYKAYDTETRTPSYTIFNASAGTDINIRGRKWVEIYLTAQNIFNRAYQNHLSRLKYTDDNPLTGHQGVYNPGRNIALRVVIPFSVSMY